MNETWMLSLLARRRTSEGSLPGTDPASRGGTPVYRCRARLLTVTTVEAATAVVARAAAVREMSLAPVTSAWAARTPNPVTRAASRGAGRDLLAAAAVECPELLPFVSPLPLPVAAGMIAAHVGLDADVLARLVGYDDVQGSLADLDPADTLVWTQTVLPDIRAMADQVAGLTDPDRIPATGADLRVVTPH
ncbi:urease accessory UreF family protein [Nocardioides donggukensis]|uniref:Urease accessory protein UreF n=1 Tax=Nocardioides donggukensis TaxID=2774019 RepID=A0A927Q2C3_9ACTN|nr:urease accessory UreF family protein [Nocardioides donggukensis]MBD8869536.1 urease accessory protein UreF [Nocardioides donggukensis]